MINFLAEANLSALGLGYDMQQLKISGTVSDENGNPLPGVNVQVEGTTIGTIADVRGKYSIEKPNDNIILIFSFIGYTPVKVSAAGKTTIDVKMTPELTSLEEVVVVGYGTQKKVNLTGAVDVIGNTELASRPSPTVSQLLQGLSPSISFAIKNENGFSPGATMDMSIRGMGSLNGGEPYVLIDGIPGKIDNLNPNDIESISVLKDAAASAIYGARAPYGVILVTTKGGKRDQKLNVTYSANVSINTPQKLPESLDSYTWVRVLNEAGDNKGGHPFSNATVDQVILYQNQDWAALKATMPNWPAGATNFGAFPQGNVWNNANLNYANTDYWDVYYGHSVNQKHDISLQGGSKSVSYYFSAGYLDESGVLNYGTDTFSRFNLLGKFDVDIADWWNFSWETRFSRGKRVKPNMTNTEGDYSMIFRSISREYPITPLQDGWGHYMSESHIPIIEDAGNDYNDDYDFWNTIKTELQPLKGWKINADFSYNASIGLEDDVEKTVYVFNVDQSLSAFGSTVPNFLEKWTNNNIYWTSNIYSSYNYSINNIHNLAVMAGTQFEKGRNRQLHGYKDNMILQDIPSFSTATGTGILYESLTQRALEGYFVRFNYNYQEKYLLEANARYDGSYVFREGNRWGFFPSFAVGWNVHKEAFWKNIEDYINTLKLKASWGSLGNQNVSPYSDLELIPLNSNKLNWIFGSGGTRSVGYTTAPNIVNQNLTWETATTKNLGISMAFLKNRLTADLDLFERLTTDMVGPSEAVPGVLGASVPRSNNATLRTRGFEFSVNWKQSLANGFSYFVDLNLSDFNSEVTKYYNPTGSLSTWYEGKQVGELWGYTCNDLFRTQEELDSYRADVNLIKLGANWKTGDLKFEDTNGDKAVNNGTNTLANHGDLSIIGNTEPHYLYGIAAGANFRGFDFSMLWKGVAKRDVYFTRYANIFWGHCNGWWESTLQPRTLDYFRDKPGTTYSGLYLGDENINTDAYWPRPYLDTTEENKNKNNVNTRYLQDGSYLRLMNIQVGYSLPQSIVSKLKIQKLRVGFSGENLLTFTKFPDGIDPLAPLGINVGGTTEGRLTYGADRIYSFVISVTY